MILPKIKSGFWSSMSPLAQSRQPAQKQEPFMAASPEELSGFGLYARYAMGGAICCGFTHSAIVPLDVVKTELQLYPERYTGMGNAFSTIVKNRGYGALLTGLGPTAAGYLMQGAFKFGFYEFFKKTYAGAFEPETAQKMRLPIFCAAAASAEFIADLALCPMEATRIRLVSQPDFAKGLPDAFGKILSQEGPMAFYKGLGPILFKQVPYTMAKFAVFEVFSAFVYNNLISTPRDELSSGQQLTISLGSGLVAGVVAAIVSHPADTVLSIVNKNKTDEPAFVAIRRIMGELGSKIWLGLGARCLMIGSLTAGQFFIYDYVKVLCGLPVGKGIQTKKEEK